MHCDRSGFRSGWVAQCEHRRHVLRCRAAALERATMEVEGLDDSGDVLYVICRAACVKELDCDNDDVVADAAQGAQLSATEADFLDTPACWLPGDGRELRLSPAIEPCVTQRNSGEPPDANLGLPGRERSLRPLPAACRRARLRRFAAKWGTAASSNALSPAYADGRRPGRSR